MNKKIKYLDNAIYWSICLLPLSIAIAPPFTYGFIITMIGAYIAKKLCIKEKLIPDSPLNFVFALFIVAALVSVRNSVDHLASVRGLVKIAQNIFIVLICFSQIRDKRHVKRIVFFFVLGVSIAALDALWQLIFGWDLIRLHPLIINIGLHRATAAFPNANVFGVYLSGIASVTLGLALYYFKGRKRAYMFLPCILAVTGIISTFSRGTAVGFYISMLVLALVRKNRLILTSLIALILMFPVIVPRNIKAWAREVNYNPLVFMLNADRISIYRNTMNMIDHHPFIGVGVNTFSKNYFQYKLYEPEGAKTAPSMYAHNHFLQMAGEIGLAGLLVFLVFLAVMFGVCIRIYSRLNDDYLKVLSLSLMGCMIAFLVNGLTETALYYSRVAMIFWYLIGFSLALGKFIPGSGENAR